MDERRRAKSIAADRNSTTGYKFSEAITLYDAAACGTGEDANNDVWWDMWKGRESKERGGQVSKRVQTCLNRSEGGPMDSVHSEREGVKGQQTQVVWL